MPNVARGNLEFYQKRFAGLTESKPLEVQDDRDANRVVMIENYALAKADFDKDKTLSDLNTNAYAVSDILPGRQRSEEHTSELQSLMRISYAVFCLKKKKKI